MRLPRALFGLVVLGALAFCAFYAATWRPEISARGAGTPDFAPQVVVKGAELAAIGDCHVCHTAPGGKFYAGGYPVQTPFGTIYGPNITPDRDTGIGSWSEAAFKRAIREGVGRSGVHLYPAFPYDHFTRLTDADISALYAFLMTREPVHQVSRPAELIFPLNVRLFAAAWKLMFLHQGEQVLNPGQSPEWNRGAYLAESVGHCGACHTPRNALGAEKGGQPYAGGEAEGWQVPALNASSPAPIPWSEQQIYSYLRTGFASEHGFAAGPMQPVVESLKAAPDADIQAIATYVASLNGSQNTAARDRKTQQALAFAQERAVTPQTIAVTTGASVNAGPSGSQQPNGATIFAGACASCHRSGGGLPASRPVELGLSSTVNAPAPTNLIHIILDGIHPSPGARGPIMPGFGGALTDPQVAALVSYVRAQYSRQPAWADVPGAVSAVRANQKSGALAP